MIKLIENSFGINSSELGAIGNRVLGRSVLVFFNFFFCAVGKFCVFINGTTEAEAKAAFTFRASRPLKPLAVDQRVVFRGVCYEREIFAKRAKVNLLKEELLVGPAKPCEAVKIINLPAAG